MSLVRSLPVPPDKRLILALGGHEFSRRAGNEAIRDYMLALTGADRPSVCLLATASGDPAEQITMFRRSLGETRAELSQVSLFRLESEPVELREHLLAQDLIYVGGGSMVNLLAVWRAHEVDAILRAAWERGTVVVGQSAGAMCWFERGITRSAGMPMVAVGLGLVPGLLSVHHSRDPGRRRALRDAVLEHRTWGIGLDDQAGVLIRGGEIADAISARRGACVRWLEPYGTGGVRQALLSSTQLSDPRPAIDEVDDAVRELRRVRWSRTASAGAWSRR
ncbi:MAG: Type 1 glutamine amidotransferase-like domain-containing protein [Solirubrobacterales bacterium]